MAARRPFVEAPEPGLVADLVRFAMMAWPRIQSREVRTIALLSSEPGEGTTTVTCLLGQVLAAHQGLRVLLCDGNPHHPGLAELAGVDNGRGWHDPAAAAPETVCVPSRWVQVAVCPHGPPASTIAAADVIALADLLEQCASSFDVTLLDCAPLEHMSEALPIARTADAAILVVEADRVSREALAHSCATVENLGLHFLGVVLNQHRRPVPNFLYRRV